MTTTGLRGAWAHGQWRLLLAAFAASSTGDWLYGVALLAWLLDRTGSVGWVAAAELARILPAAFLGSLAGVVADRWDRRALLVGVGVARAGLMLAMAAVVAVDAPPALAITLVAISSLAGTPYRPAITAATPQVVDEPSLAAANAAEVVVGEITWFLGPLLCSIVLVLSSAEWAFVLNAAMFVLSALLILRLRLPRVEPAADADGARSDPSFLGQLKEGLAVVQRSPDLLVLSGLVCAVLFAFGFEQVLHVLVAQDRLGVGASGLGWLTAAIGVGGLLGTPFTMKIARSRWTGEALAISAVLMGAPLALLAVVTDLWVAVAILVFEGFGSVVFEVLTVTSLQRLAPAHALGRVFGLQDSAGSTTNLLGALLAPLLVAAISLEAALLVGGGFLVAYAAVTLPPLARAGRRAQVAALRLQPRVEMLARLSMLEGATQEVLERIAAAVEPVRYPAGTTLMTEGDPARDLFVVLAGRLDILVGGGRINQVGPGDVVGEIGVVARRPRTATAVTVTEVDLWRVSGEAFLGAIERQSITPDGLRRGIADRLARTPTVEVG